MTFSRSLVWLAGACLGLILASGAWAQGTASIGVHSNVLDVRLTSPSLIGPYVSTAYVVPSDARDNGNSTVASPSQKRSMQGIALYEILSASNTTHSCLSATCDRVDAHISTGKIELLDGLVSIDELADDIDFNLLTLKVTGKVEVRSVSVAGGTPTDLTIHIPSMPGDTATGTEIPVHGPAQREVLNILGIVILREQLQFDGVLTVGKDPDISGDFPLNFDDFGPFGPTQVDNEVALSLKGSLYGGLGGPYDVEMELGDVRVLQATP